MLIKKIFITGGAGFIGSHICEEVYKKFPKSKIIIFDKLTYAGNLENLKDIENDPRYQFVKGDICQAKEVDKVVRGVDAILNFAAETHVDRSLFDPQSFIKTDILGTQVLLEATRKYNISRFLQVSTDEIYGSIEKGSFKESDSLSPSSPYSASKAGGDLMVLAYFKSFRLPVLITRGSNTFGPYQYPEKFIPLFITNLLENKKVPLYGKGENIRDWIYVLDHCSGIDFVFHRGKEGEIYNLGGGNERSNIEITKFILEELGKDESYIEYVTDRPGHDFRYSLNCSKIKNLGWQPKYSFEEALKETIRWYKENKEWWEKIKSGKYFQEWYEKQYRKKGEKK